MTLHFNFVNCCFASYLKASVYLYVQRKCPLWMYFERYLDSSQEFWNKEISIMWECTSKMSLPTCSALLHVTVLKEKKKDIWQNRMTKVPSTTEKSKKAKWQHKKTPTKTSITQWLRNDLGRSVWVTTATKLVLLNRFTVFHPYRKSCVIKRTHI